MSCLAIAAGAPTSGSAQHAPLPDSLIRRIDSLFARYARTDAPGCAAGVFQDGTIVFAKGYGSANLEYGVPITPTTPFISGSVAKQFTAAAIALLVERGRLSLDDDVRKYVPELPEYGPTITVGHLVHHTSGLRDFWSLVQTAGMRPDDGYTVDDVIRIAARQKRLNFAPGTEYDYSNTGYVLMGVVVHRVTGKTLREFAAEEIFGPLGMTSTHYHDDHNMVVPGRASAYSPAPGGAWRINIWDNDIVGQGGVITTLAELHKWDENFYTGRVGGAGFLKRQLERGRLANGTELSYAFGLIVGEYRGLPTVAHSGSTGGYRNVIIRFPSLHGSVVVLCNVSNADAEGLARRMADVVWASRFSRPVPTPAQRAAARSDSGVALAPLQLTRLAGRYYSPELDATFDLAVSGGLLLLRRARGQVDTLRAVAARTFRAGGLVLRFPPDANGEAASFTVDAGRARGMEFVRASSH